MSGVALISVTKLDLETLLPLARKGLGYSVSAQADAHTLQLTPPAHTLAILAAFKDQYTKAEYNKSQLQLFQVGFLIATHESVLLDLLEASGTPFATSMTQVRDTRLAIVMGSLEDWRNAVRRGCRADVDREIREIFNKIYTQLVQAGLGHIFKNRKKQPLDDNTFLLKGPQ